MWHVDSRCESACAFVFFSLFHKVSRKESDTLFCLEKTHCLLSDNSGIDTDWQLQVLALATRR